MSSIALNPARRSARERALEVLYEADIKAKSVTEILGLLPIAPDPYAVELVRGVESNQVELDVVIAQFLKQGWSLNRLPTIDRLILRLAVEELTHHADVPTAVVLDESVRLAKGFSTDDSGRFVNGVLASVARSVRNDATVPTVVVEDDLSTAIQVVGAVTARPTTSAPAPGLALEDEPRTALDD
jgi:transcription antitermination protein NusB